jgi:uncharacterized integral membrane protein (TIGR00697 family)
MNGCISHLIETLQTFPTEIMGVLTYLTAIGIMFLLHRFFEKEGLYLFIILAVVIANIQSLKAIEITFFNSPVAMGTILFTNALMATDLLAEFYGRRYATKAIWLGFSGMLMMSVFMILTLGTKIISADPGTELYRYIETHQAMAVLFTPAPALLLASLIAYLAGQYIDMGIFLWLKKRTKNRFLSTRTLIATLFSALIDNCIFSVLAWRIFYPLSIDLKTFIFTYILGAFSLRVLIGLANTLFIYFLPRYKSPALHTT